MTYMTLKSTNGKVWDVIGIDDDKCEAIVSARSAYFADRTARVVVEAHAGDYAETVWDSNDIPPWI